MAGFRLETEVGVKITSTVGCCPGDFDHGDLTLEN